MKRNVLLALAAVMLLASAAPAFASPGAKAPVQVRVVTWKGAILVDRPVVAQTTRVPTSSRATCFGGVPTDGTRLLEGTTALGALQRVTAGVATLRPLLLTNAFDFGIGLCAVGSFAPVEEEWWALRVNGALASAGGDSTFLKKGDSVLWYLDRSYNAVPPDELRLTVPSTVRRDGLATVRVQALDGGGKARPAGGARVRMGGTFVGTTDAAGRIGVRIRSRSTLVARLPDLIPSNRAVVQVKAGSARRSMTGR